MKVLITKRVDGSCRVGNSRMKHWATGYTYSEDEIEEEKYFDIPGAYLCQSGEIGWKEQSVMDHPDIKAWIGASR